MQKQEETSCCGVICSNCVNFPQACRGCNQIQGKVFWLEYTGGDVCGIYRCCVMEKGYPHCGHCSELPCGHYEGKDPTKTDAENEQDFQSQMAVLEGLKKQQP